MIIREKMALKVAVCCEVFPKGFIIKNKKCTAISLFERTALKIMQGARASEMCDVTTYDEHPERTIQQTHGDF